MFQFRQPDDLLLRRMRRTEHLRDFIAEREVTLSHLCHPVFVREDLTRPQEVENMPGVHYFPVAEAIDEIKAVADLGIKHFVIRPRPEQALTSDPQKSIASEARVIEKISQACPDVTKIIDGYFGMMRPNGVYGSLKADRSVDLAKTTRELQDHALAQARAGADVIVTLGRVDNSVRSIRQALDENGCENTAILAYSINFASSLAHAMLDGTEMGHNAHRQTIASKIGVGNIDEALRQTALEIAHGADFIGVKPATIFLDAIAAIKQNFRIPVATYIVSKEYVMVKAAAQRGWVDEQATVMEYMLSMRRAGADKIFSYWVRDMARWLK